MLKNEYWLIHCHILLDSDINIGINMNQLMANKQRTRKLN